MSNTKIIYTNLWFRSNSIGDQVFTEYQPCSTDDAQEALQILNEGYGNWDFAGTYIHQLDGSQPEFLTIESAKAALMKAAA